MRTQIRRNLLGGVALAGLLASPLFLGAAPAPATARPYLGMAAEAIAQDAAPNGITVHSVSPDGPAAKAGLKSSDRIVMADGKEVKNFDALKETLANHKPGDKVALKVLRDGKEQMLTVTLGEAPQTPTAAGETPHGKPVAYLGVQTQALTAELKEHLGAGVDKGALVTNVMPDSPAAAAGLAEEDVITHVGTAAVNNPAELRDAIHKAGIGKEVALKVMRGGKALDLKVRLQEAPAALAALPRWSHQVPEGFDKFPEHFRPFFSGMEKLPSLEKKLQDLENRLHALEQKATK